MKILKNLSFIAIAMMFSLASNAQKYYTKAGTIEFLSDASMEKITAINTKANSVIDYKSGAIQWSALIKAFKFEKSLMEEHFNENYMESSKYPKANFKGVITNLNEVDLTKDGSYTANIKGTLEIHGQKNDIETQAVFTVKKGKIVANSEFDVLLADYNIEIPSVVADNISKNVQITINTEYQLLPE